MALWGALSPREGSAGCPVPPRGTWGAPWGALCPPRVFEGVRGVLGARKGVRAVPSAPEGCPGCRRGGSAGCPVPPRGV